MSIVTLTPLAASRDGVNLTAAFTTVVTANTYEFVNDGRTRLVVNNDTLSSCNVVVATPNTEDGNAITDKTVAVAASKIYEFGPYLPSVYNNANGKVSVTFNQTVKIAAIRQ